MSDKHKLASVGLVAAVLLAVSLVAVTLATGGHDGPEYPAADVDAPDLFLEYPMGTAIASGDVFSLPWDELIQAADLVVIGTASGQSDYQKVNAGNPELTAVVAAYTLTIERTLKGNAVESVEFRKVVAYEDSQLEASYFIDAASPLAFHQRYLLILDDRGDGTTWLVAEPFRFRLEGGVASAESTLVELSHESAYLEREFPDRSETEVISDIEALVAAEAAAR